MSFKYLIVTNNFKIYMSHYSTVGEDRCLSLWEFQNKLLSGSFLGKLHKFIWIWELMSSLTLVRLSSSFSILSLRWDCALSPTIPTVNGLEVDSWLITSVIRPSRVVNFPPRVPSTNSSSNSGILNAHVSDCVQKYNNWNNEKWLTPVPIIAFTADRRMDKNIFCLEE